MLQDDGRWRGSATTEQQARTYGHSGCIAAGKIKPNCPARQLIEDLWIPPSPKATRDPTITTDILVSDSRCDESLVGRRFVLAFSHHPFAVSHSRVLLIVYIVKASG